jgi:hypothetical protein
MATMPITYTSTSTRATTKRIILSVTCLLLRFDSSECFVPRYTFGRSVTPTVPVPFKRNAKLEVFRNEDPNLATKLTSPFAEFSLALPLLLASATSLFYGTSAIATTADHAAGALSEFSLALPLLLASAISRFHGTSAIAATADHAAGALSLLFSSPLIEAEVLGDVAHLALDFATLFGRNSLAIEVAAVLGRIAAMAADYLPDHSMLPEELVFQVFMLGIAWMAVVKSTTRAVLSAVACDITLRDGKAFSLLFGPAGITWSQFKALSLTALDWVTVEPGKIITSDEDTNEHGHYVYWLYMGQTVIQSQGKVLDNVTRVGGPPSLTQQDAGRGFIGEMRLFRSMQAKKTGRNGKRKTKKNKDSDSNNNEETTKSYPCMTVKAGDAGATLLRIHTSNLIMSMDRDVELANAVRSLVFQCMHDKLAARHE